MTKEYPLLYSAPMVRAVLAGIKTQTRRLSDVWAKRNPGERLWVRENLRLEQEFGWQYSADGTDIDYEKLSHEIFFKDKTYIPSIHMPRRASRILLEITDIRSERLQDITEEDAKAEGITKYELDFSCIKYGCENNFMAYSARLAYRQLWNSINKEEFSWENNPKVWIVSFKVLSVHNTCTENA